MSPGTSRDDDLLPKTDGRAREHLGFSRASWMRAGREGAVVAAGQLAVAVAGLVGIRLLTELAPREVFGEANLLLGVVQLGRLILVAPFISAQVRFHPEYVIRGQARWFTREISRLTWLGSALFALLGLVAYSTWRWNDGGGYRPMMLAALAAYFFVDTARAIKINRLVAERRRALTAWWQGTEHWLTVFVPATALLLTATTTSYLVGFAVGTALVYPVFGGWLDPPLVDREDGTPEPRKEFSRRMFRYGLPFVPLALCGWLSSLADRYVIAGFLGTADAGLYVAAYSVASRPFLMVGAVFTNFARPILFQAESSGDARRGRQVFALWLATTATVCALGVLGFAFLGDWVAKLLLAPAYREGSVALFVWIGLGHAMYVIVQVIESRLMSLERSRRLVVPSVSAAVANLGVSIALVPALGALGSGITKAIAFGMHLLFISVALLRARRGSPGGPASGARFGQQNHVVEKEFPGAGSDVD